MGSNEAAEAGLVQALNEPTAGPRTSLLQQYEMMHGGAVQKHRRHTRPIADCEYVENQPGALQLAGPGLGTTTLMLGGPPIWGHCGRR
ncbi:hypothetical protein PGTUg99_005781 [Puccinia graminis f. sp. tritici]|uniref:Uncharacterized protein n=1 Tax=Puccinia graminis f. sp. tritici TaxID=56615 RepID=A0A5B0RYP7_PUCGR|nr:hypothetical protein PGTUg99_005781 [Puccinia graminis f. sp. tritici]